MGLFSLWGSKEPTTPAAAPVQQAQAQAPTSAPAQATRPSYSNPPDATTVLPTDPQTPVSAWASKLDGESPPYPPIFSARSLKQLGFFFGGAGFLMLTTVTARRSAIRHAKLSQLKFFQPTHNGARHGQAIKPGEKDPMIAFEALKLATLGTISFGIMTVGGISWAFDIASLPELQVKARRSMYGRQGKVDEDAEKEVAEWLVKMLGPQAIQAATEPATEPSPENPEQSKKT
ncbi:hypothetical protein V8F33_010956 [Rhypophila sp. PSN 637]